MCCPRLRPRKPGDGELRVDAVAMCRVATAIGRASVALIPGERPTETGAKSAVKLDGELAIRIRGVRAFVAGEGTWWT